MAAQDMPRNLILLAIHASAGDLKRSRDLMLRSRFQRLPFPKIAQTILEIHLFAGFPAAIEALILLRQCPLGKAQKTRPDRSTRKLYYERGVKVCRQVYGENFKKLMKNMQCLHPDLARWIIDGYGKVLARPGLTLLERELIAVGVLAAGGWLRQLESHLKGVANV
ncbi:MAG: Carboxymuconolactone decarboxylase [Bacteroidetes bacterium]|nr:Carboxymuconolactone decarboxylase [Bacteroidota bacterium]